MARDTRSEKDQVSYRTYDNRVVTRDAIEGALRALETRERNRERWERIRTWVLVGVVVVVLMAAFVALIWWRLANMS